MSILKVERRLKRQGYSPFAHQPSGINATEWHLPGEDPASRHHVEQPFLPDRARDPRAITYGMYSLPDVRTGGSVLNTLDPLGCGYPAELDDAEEF